MKNHLYAFWHRLIRSQFYRSWVRLGLPKSDRGRVMVVLHNVFLHLHPAKVHSSGLRIRHTFCLGGTTFFLFIILTVTGVLLMFYYVPDTGRAYEDMKDLAFVVPFGMFLRNLHRWAAHAMVVTVIFHMARVFFTGSYRPPREFNWIVGVVLLVLTLLLSYTGYLLPWDQLAFWAVTVGTNMGAAAPLVGHNGPFSLTHIDNDIRYALIGGTEIGQNALLRFYVLHCILLPLVAVVLMAVHFWRVRKDGGLARPL
jgi:quinol-cytochrome oxidoreductase complex cytochrome b subunit